MAGKLISQLVNVTTAGDDDLLAIQVDGESTVKNIKVSKFSGGLSQEGVLVDPLTDQGIYTAEGTVGITTLYAATASQDRVIITTTTAGIGTIIGVEVGESLNGVVNGTHVVASGDEILMFMDNGIGSWIIQTDVATSEQVSENLLVTAQNTISNLSFTPYSTVQFYVNGIFDYLKSITVAGLTVDASSFFGDYGFNIESTDIIYSIYGTTEVSSDIIDILIPTATNTIPDISTVPFNTASVSFYVNGILDYGRILTVTGVSVDATGFNAYYGYDITTSDVITAIYN